MEEAIINQDIDKLQTLLQQGVDPNTINAEDYSMLSVAVFTSTIEIIQLLLDYGANPNLGALVHASADGCSDVVYLLLEYGADPSISDMILGNTPLHVACQMDNLNGDYLETIRILLGYHNSKGELADVNAENNKCDIPLRFAIENEDLPIIDFLLSRHADPQHINNKGTSILMIAIKTNNIDIVDLLVRYGADLNELDPEMKDIEAGREASEDYGGDTHDHNNFELPLELAVRKGLFEMTKYLIEHGADPFYTDYADITLLHLVYNKYENDESNYAETLKYLLNYRDEHGNKLDINECDKYGDTPLDVAIYANRPDLVQILLDYGAEVDFDLLPPEMSPEMRQVLDDYLRGPMIKDPGID
jgi:ankyrin repeat protein